MQQLTEGTDTHSIPRQRDPCKAGDGIAGYAPRQLHYPIGEGIVVRTS